MNKLSPQALWLLGSLLLVFGALGGNSLTARKLFFAGFQPVEAVFVWFAAWSIIASTAFLGFALLSRAPGKAVSDWVLAGSLFVGIFGLVQVSSLASTFTLAWTLDSWGLFWVRPFSGLLISLVASGGMLAGFLVYRRLLLRASRFDPFSLSVAMVILGANFGVLSFFLPEGVNQSFTANIWPLLWGGALLLFSGSDFAGRSFSRTAVVRRVDIRQAVTSLLLGLVPMVPIIRYLVSNTELSLGAATLLFAVAAGLALVGVIAIPLLLAPWVDQKINSVTASAGLYVFFSMASLSQNRTWYGEGNLVEQIVVLLIAFVVLAMFTQLSNRFLSVVVIALLALEIILPLWAPASSAPDSSEASGLSQQAEWEQLVTTSSWVATPNVYLLVFESYANEETIASYGIDNSEQMHYLLDSGFTIYEGTYSVGAASFTSMSSVLDVAVNTAGDGRPATSGDAVVNRIFQNQGYDTHGVFASGSYLGDSPKYSSFFPPSDGSVDSSIAESVFRGEFRFEYSHSSADYSNYLEEKRRILGLGAQNQVFLYTHNKFPGHSQNSGKCRPDETERYANGLEQANREMTLDLTAIDDLDEAIVIIAGDHGPYLTKNCWVLGGYSSDEINRLDVQDRYGSFVAVRWPAELRGDLEIQILQDIFPAVFSALIGSESLFEEARIPSHTLGDAAGSVRVMEGVLEGGQHDGERLFREPNRRIGR